MSFVNTQNEITKWNLTKYVHDLHAENYAKLMKEIEDTINKWKDIPGPHVDTIYYRC